MFGAAQGTSMRRSPCPSVAPSAIEPSRISRGTDRKPSSVERAMTGITSSDRKSRRRQKRALCRVLEAVHVRVVAADEVGDRIAGRVPDATSTRLKAATPMMNTEIARSIVVEKRMIVRQRTAVLADEDSRAYAGRDRDQRCQRRSA